MIPIENIYFLLCYAWDRLEQRHLVKAGMSGQKSIYELLASILVRELPTLWKKGYFKNYTEQNQYIQGIRGKVHVSPSLATGASLIEFMVMVKEIVLLSIPPLFVPPLS